MKNMPAPAWPLCALAFLDRAQADGTVQRAVLRRVPENGRSPGLMQAGLKVVSPIGLAVLVREVLQGLPLEATGVPPAPQCVPLCLSTQVEEGTPRP